MTLLAAGRLWLLVLVVALAGAYVVLARRRRHYAVRFTNLDLLASVAPRRPGWRRHAPAAAVALALCALVVGLARPVAERRVPREAATVMVVLDTSASMDATDVSPSRLAAAVSAAGRFVDDLPARLRVGLVAYDRTARVLTPPTTDHALVASTLERLSTGPGTASGDALAAALDAMAVAGSEGAGAVVLLSDGVTTVGMPVEEAAAQAAQQRVPVTTIAFGTESGTVEVQGRSIPVPADPETMAAVAETTGGRTFTAESAGQLDEVYEDIGTRVGYEVEQREIATTFMAVGFALLLAAMAAALLWSGRML